MLTKSHTEPERKIRVKGGVGVKKDRKQPGVDPVVLIPSQEKFKHNLSFSFIFIMPF